MNRRRFLQQALGSALALGPAATWSGRAAAQTAPATFEERLARERWLAGWKSVRRESLRSEALLEGTLPAELSGVLYRNGPALFDRAGLRYRHWFDGDGMVHAWRLGRGGARHEARMVATGKYVKEQRAGRFMLPAAGTTVPDALPVRNNDDMNTANTAVMFLDGRLFALWEGGSAFELDPDTLRTLGPVTWREELAALPFSAHPLRDRDGTLWNFGMLSFVGGSGLLIWHLGADGRVMQSAALAAEERGYLHSFAMTERHLVFVLTPFREADARGAFFERLRFATDQPCRIAVVAKSSLDDVRWFEADFAAIYHFGDAFELGGRIVVRAVRHGDPEEARSPMSAALRGELESNAGTELLELHIDPAAGRAQWHSCGVDEIEFPTFDPRTASTGPARLYAPTTTGEAVAPYFNSIACFDMERGTREVYRYGAQIMAEEHCFVPRPGSTAVDDGWLIGTLLDHGRGRSGIAVLDARRVGDGPLMQAWLRYTIPLGFHGCFEHT